MNLVIDIGIVLFKALMVITALLTLTALLSWVERKQSAVMQDRVGPNRANIFGLRVFGLFHIIADAVKMIMKEDYVVPGANRFLHSLAPFLSLTMPLIVFCAIPFGDTLNVLGKVIPLQVVNINAGLLFILAIGSLSAYGAVLGGISSNNNYALLGGLRAMAQTISYEVVLGPALLGVIIVFNSLDLNEIVRAQGVMLYGWVPKWGVVVQPLAFLIFLIAAMAETKRAPFDIPEGESEIIGYFVEYSGMKFGMFFLGEFAEVGVAAALITTFFFGGWQVPFLAADGFSFPWGASLALPYLAVAGIQVAAFVVKLCALCFFLLLIRWTLPRFRYDQLIGLGWKKLLPLSIINVLVTVAVLEAIK